MNHVVLIGRITKDAELKKTSTGKSVVSFTLAVNRRCEGADFPSCVAWEKTAEIIHKYAHKGSQIAVKGSLQTRSYESNGKNVYITEVLVNEVQLLDSKKPQEEKQNDDFMAPTIDVSSDDLPF